MPPVIVNPNAGTQWATPGGELDMRALLKKRIEDGGANRFTDWANRETPKEDPRRSEAYVDSENRDYLCKPCNTVCHSMAEFNSHCEIDPRGNGREMKCEVDARFALGLGAPPRWSPESADDTAVTPGAGTRSVLNPKVIADAVAASLAPTLSAIAEALTGITALLAGKKPPKKNVGKKANARSAGSLPGAPRRGRPPSLRRVGQPQEPVVDPSPESEAPPTA